jgi:hypothetical protein
MDATRAIGPTRAYKWHPYTIEIAGNSGRLGQIGLINGTPTPSKMWETRAKSSILNPNGVGVPFISPRFRPSRVSTYLAFLFYITPSILYIPSIPHSLHRSHSCPPPARQCSPHPPSRCCQSIALLPTLDPSIGELG